MKKGDKLSYFKVQCPHCQATTDIFLASKCPNCGKGLFWSDSLVAYIQAQDLMRTADSERDWKKAKKLWIQAGGASGADYWQEKIDFCNRMLDGYKDLRDLL